MIQVYFSHVGEAPLAGVTEPETVYPGKLRDIFTQIETRHPGFQSQLYNSTGTNINSATLIFKHIEIDSDGRLLESKHTEPIRDLDEEIASADENLLIAIFHPKRVMKFLLDTLTHTEQNFEYAGKRKEYRSYISAPDTDQGGQRLFATAEPEALYPFTNEKLISELVTDG